MEKQLLTMANISILPATESDVSTILDLIRQLSVYEKLEHMLTGNEAMLHGALFADRPSCECVVARDGAICFLFVGKFIAKLERFRLGPRGRSRLLNQLSFGGYNKHFPNAVTPFDWLSRDTHEVARYVNDPKCGFIATTQSWIDLLTGIPALHDPANHARIRRDLPLYLFGGHRDPVNHFGQGLEMLVAAYRRAGVRSIRHRLYPEARHEVNLPDLRRQQARDLSQHGVAGGVAMRVVDYLEAVEVHHHQRQGTLETNAAQPLLLQSTIELTPVQ